VAAEQERKCIEEGCEEPAGSPWTHLWCLKHDEERRERITASMEKISESFAVRTDLR
jgi:hypothetical protein